MKSNIIKFIEYDILIFGFATWKIMNSNFLQYIFIVAHVHRRVHDHSVPSSNQVVHLHDQCMLDRRPCNDRVVARVHHSNVFHTVVDYDRHSLSCIVWMHHWQRWYKLDHDYIEWEHQHVLVRNQHCKRLVVQGQRLLRIQTISFSDFDLWIVYFLNSAVYKQNITNWEVHILKRHRIVRSQKIEKLKVYKKLYNFDWDFNMCYFQTLSFGVKRSCRCLFLSRWIWYSEYRRDLKPKY